jgi:FtsZ-binding cell division protein ZapB
MSLNKYNEMSIKVKNINDKLNKFIDFFLTNFIKITKEFIKEKKTVDFMLFINKKSSNKKKYSSKDLIYKLNDLYDVWNYYIPNITNYCKQCSSDLIEKTCEKKIICRNCGYVEYELDSFNYFGETNKFAGNLVKKHPEFFRGKGIHQYNKLDHLKNCMMRLQGKERINIKQETINLLSKKIKEIKEKNNFSKIPNYIYLTKNKLKKIVNDLKLINYKDHIPFLYYVLTGKRYINFTKSERNKICEVFKKLKNHIHSYIHNSNELNRTSFTSYWITLRVIMIYLKLPNEKINQIPRLKSREKLKEIDKMLIEIFGKLNLDYKSII